MFLLSLFNKLFGKTIAKIIGIIILIIIVIVLAVVLSKKESMKNVVKVRNEKFIELTKKENKVVEKPELILVYEPWCGYSKRFIGLDNNQNADWIQIKNAVSQKDIVIKELNFENEENDYATQKEIKNLLGELQLEGYPTIYIKKGKEYYKFNDKRNVGNVVSWINKII